MRPLHEVFGDSNSYARTYHYIELGLSEISPSIPRQGEWIWEWTLKLCAQLTDIHVFFTIVSVGYFGFTLWACKKLVPNNTLATVLFLMGSISFYTYSVNGLRNGLACAIMLVVIAFAAGDTRQKIIAGFLAFVAINIHRSTAIPIVALIAASTCVKDFKFATAIWIGTIIISLIAGKFITPFIADLELEHRSYYLTPLIKDNFSRSGFRWDFLLYSTMPILLGYYVIIKRGVQDKTYSLLLNTFTLANAIWVLLIHASYSNRFAYLSWFMYPLVLAYPLFKLDIWGKKQGRLASMVMLAHAGFTWAMTSFYW